MRLGQQTKDKKRRTRKRKSGRRHETRVSQEGYRKRKERKRKSRRRYEAWATQQGYRKRRTRARRTRALKEEPDGPGITKITNQYI